jgi:hypothetical protein
VNKNRMMTPAKIAFLKEEQVNLIKVHYMHVWKYHNGTPSYN